MTAPVRLTPEHGRLIEAALTAYDAEQRGRGIRDGLRGIAGVAELYEVARQLRTDGARVVLDPHTPSGALNGAHSITGPGGGAHDAGAPRWLSRREVARHIGVSLATVDRRVADGTLPCRRIGGRTLFDPAAITQELPCTA